ncbi:hypothetical protein PAECIP111893_04541 [Paenibacillus plantiphilus]|uniref:ATP-grasp domain-containing protein n=1 Tax=Paenibacillus plantiphilus TaxID=2905650 RepID=A0ABM9CNA0_9BACL|nr:YheC/YheD family protein [Paenibacillus plantiphilus]CAH1219310.1 hypothetical protein PAECIP111893_04541 [Paenibacillus plantiphilus]
MTRLMGVVPTVGVMVSERAGRMEEAANGPIMLPEDAYCRNLCQSGKKLGLLVCVFDTSCFGSSTRGMTGYLLENGQWKATCIPYPHCVYDRSLCSNTEQRQRHNLILAQLQRRKPYILLNGELPGKWEVYSAMRQDDKLRPYLPPTYRFEGIHTLAHFMSDYLQGLFLKPSAGMQGRGAIRLLQTPKGWELDGRNRRNKPISCKLLRNSAPTDTDDSASAQALLVLKRFIGSSSYIVQPYLRLVDQDGKPYDIRALIQKDEHGRWSLTGSALREGIAGGITANLHGGGAARHAEDALEERFGPDKAASLLRRIRRISEHAALCLESRFGRFAELGLDFGIEPDGRLWLLEANAKPGRSSFAADRDLAKLAVERPLRYAKLIITRRYPFVQVQNLVHHHDDAAVDRFQRKYVQEVHP